MTDHDPIDTAWRTHDAIGHWTAKVDSKATFALSIESAVLAGVVALSGSGGALHGLENASLGLFRVGVILLIAGVVAAAAAVIPQIRSRPVRTEWRENFIFFGHLRQWNAEALAAKLLEADLLPVLTRQLVASSKIAWSKHRLLQVSLLLALVGAGLVMLAARFAA